MTILDLPFYLYIVIAATAWLFHVAEMHLMYQPLSVMQRGWSKQQKKAFDKAVYERDRTLEFYTNTGFCQWCEEREARRHHLAKAALLIHDWRLSLTLRLPLSLPPRSRHRAAYALVVIVGIPMLNLQRPSFGFMGRDPSSDFLLHLAGV